MIDAGSTAARNGAMGIEKILRDGVGRRGDSRMRCVGSRTEMIVHPFFREHDGIQVRIRA
ncbi:MAG: hypothetical protein ABIS07_12795 [Dokdonella sp.]